VREQSSKLLGFHLGVFHGDFHVALFLLLDFLLESRWLIFRSERDLTKQFLLSVNWLVTDLRELRKTTLKFDDLGRHSSSS